MSSRSPQNTLNNTPTLITLTYAGDVILKLGGHEQPVIRLLCSSVCLSHGSSVFKAMFRPDRFAEGQDLSFTSPPEVPLPEDDPDSVKRLCEILHSQPGDHDEWICTNHYAEFAIVVDKYDCRNATLPWFKMHFHHILAPKSCPDTEKLLFVCYVLDFPKEFEAVTKQLMLNHNRPIDPLTAMHDTDLVPLKFLRDLEQRRKLNVEKVARALEPWFVRNVTLRHSSFRICPRARALATSWLYNLAVSGLLILRNYSIDHIEKCFDHFEGLPLDTGSEPCTRNEQGRCECDPTDEEMAKREVKRSILRIHYNESFCLDCVRMKVSSGTISRPCRSRHSGACGTKYPD